MTQVLVFRGQINLPKFRPEEFNDEDMLKNSSFQTLKSLPIITKQQIRRFTRNPVVMEAQNDKVYAHYNHTDSCKFSRWTARESFEFMYARPWQEVVDFYSNVVNGHLSLFHLFETETDVHDDDKIVEVSDETELLEGDTNVGKPGRWARVTFKIVLSYHGGSFDGWQKQPGLHTVQGNRVLEIRAFIMPLRKSDSCFHFLVASIALSVVEKSLGIFVDEQKAQHLKDKSKPLEGCAIVAGRTDKGVSDTWRKDVKPREIEDAINDAAPGKVRVVSISEVPRAFHPNFSAKWRRYLYIFPLNDGENREEIESEEDIENFISYDYDERRNECDELASEENIENLIISDEDEREGAKKPRKFSDHGKGIKVMCVELVANRFLRKMVRVLVATSVREAAAGAQEDALLKLMDATCRRATAPPAPPDGLCLVDVGYTEFDPQNCLIP
ncbi:unnamed protein product [Dovyalis caffra]|uniref:tRNA pseudouridine synthase n=1 Tax=Dovyalis caffra TaxID=77055 RepID=A0AAV1S2Z4_9ROSI|nr:unnamed protein product [Dovyalis caffra]